MTLIFISYRRGDSLPRAARLHTDLAVRFGSENVFMDLEAIRPGTDFVKHLERELASCQVGLAVIGSNWLRTKRSEEPISDPSDDFVRFELESLIGRAIHLVPVLVGGASMPAAAELPADLRGVTRLNAIALDDARWQHDLVLSSRRLAKASSMVRRQRS